MKLAHANFFVVPTNPTTRQRAALASAGVRRVIATHPTAIRRTGSRLVARWRLCTETQRLECSWSLEAASLEGVAPEGQLRRRVQTRRSTRSSRRPSQIRNKVL